MTMGDCLRTNKLIILRGNSGSGKTTIAKELQQVFGNNTMLISQDVIRRDMLKVKDGENTKALPLLEEIAQAARIETRKHFGNSICMFTPIYIANYCENYCIYCGFNCHNKINRAQLNAEEIEKEMAAIAKTGLQEILILTVTARSPKL